MRKERYHLASTDRSLEPTRVLSVCRGGCPEGRAEMQQVSVLHVTPYVVLRGSSTFFFHHHHVCMCVREQTATKDFAVAYAAKKN